MAHRPTILRIVLQPWSVASPKNHCHETLRWFKVLANSYTAEKPHFIAAGILQIKITGGFL
jgi:hypothetical protein